MYYNKGGRKASYDIVDLTTLYAPNAPIPRPYLVGMPVIDARVEWIEGQVGITITVEMAKRYFQQEGIETERGWITTPPTAVH